MKTYEKLWAATLALVAIAGVMYGASALGESQAAMSEKHKRQTLEDAKNGWVYICGWNQCLWERIPRHQEPPR